MRPWLEPVPVIVAESLGLVEDPLLPLLRPRGPEATRAIVAAMATDLARPMDPRTAPDWLLEDQRPVFARLLPILARYHGALLADPVGSGKTWIALAIAQAWRRTTRVVVFAPAALVSQWERTAAELGIEITAWSHEKVSRGRLPEVLHRQPESGRPLVIIDESHHFRNPGTRRYGHLAPGLVGRTVLLLSATPVVNRLGDLGNQLRLGIRDDALNAFGLSSLAHHLETVHQSDPAIGEVVISRAEDLAGKPSRIERRVRAADLDDGGIEELAAAIGRLALSTECAVAGLIRGVLWRALASSPLALLAALRRYRLLLQHARDAREAGRELDRASLRSFVGADEQQLAMWEMLPPAAAGNDLVLEDLARLDTLIETVQQRSATPDEKCRRLAGLINDGKRSLVFVGARQTVRFLRQHLAPLSIAWCTGEAAGIGISRVPRDVVLSWFGPGNRLDNGPRALITTDVAAEGLDLQEAARVVHYDLPWTAVRLDQRDGRALRLGSSHSMVEVIRFDPPAAVERRLAQLAVLARKRRLPRQAGLDARGGRWWGWRESMASLYGNSELDPVSGPRFSGRGAWGMVTAPFRGAIAGITLDSIEPVTGRPIRLASVIGCLAADGAWSEDPVRVEAWLRAVGEGLDVSSPDERLLEETLRALAPIVRGRLRAIGRHRWHATLPSAPVAALAARLHRLASLAARARDARRIADIERAMGFASGGHTAGEERWIENLRDLPDDRLMEVVRRCPPPERGPGPVVPRLTGLVIFAASIGKP